MKDIRDNYMVIQGWMVKDLKLKGNRKDVFALIYGFCQNNEGTFTGSLNYIAEWIGATRRTAINVINSLEQDGLIIKEQEARNNILTNKININHSKVKELRGSEKLSPLVKKEAKGSEKLSPGVVKNFHRGSEKLSPNNISNNISNNIRESAHANFESNISLKNQPKQKDTPNSAAPPRKETAIPSPKQATSNYGELINSNEFYRNQVAELCQEFRFPVLGFSSIVREVFTDYAAKDEFFRLIPPSAQKENHYFIQILARCEKFIKQKQRNQSKSTAPTEHKPVYLNRLTRIA